MKKVVEKNEKYLTEKTFEKHMASIARSFDKIDHRLDNHDKLFQAIITRLTSMNDEAKEHRTAMAYLMQSDVRQNKTLDEAFIRIERLERKVK